MIKKTILATIVFLAAGFGFAAPAGEPAAPFKLGAVFQMPLADGSTAPARIESVDGQLRLTAVVAGQFADWRLTAWSGPGPDPIPPVPPPPPPPVTFNKLVLVRESGGSTADQARQTQVVNRVRAYAIDAGLRWRLVDPQSATSERERPAWIQSVFDELARRKLDEGASLVFCAEGADGAVSIVDAAALPATADEAVTLVKAHGG